MSEQSAESLPRYIQDRIHPLFLSNSQNLGERAGAIYLLANNCKSFNNFIDIISSFPQLTVIEKEYILRKSNIQLNISETLKFLSVEKYENIREDDYLLEKSIINQTEIFLLSGEIIEFLLKKEIPLEIKIHLLSKLKELSLADFLKIAPFFSNNNVILEAFSKKITKISIEEIEEISLSQTYNKKVIDSLYIALRHINFSPEKMKWIVHLDSSNMHERNRYKICELFQGYDITPEILELFKTEKPIFGYLEILAQKCNPYYDTKIAYACLESSRSNDSNKIFGNIADILIGKLRFKTLEELLIFLETNKDKGIDTDNLIKNQSKFTWNENTYSTLKKYEKVWNFDIIIRKLSILEAYHHEALKFIKELNNFYLAQRISECFVYSPPFSLLDEYEEVSEEERKKNIRKMNNLQSHMIFGNGNLLQSDKRTLVLYWRQTQGSFIPHFLVFFELIKNYIKSGKSPLWSDFKVITRFDPDSETGYEIPVTKEDRIFYLQEAFRIESNICVDSIALNHGTIEDIPGSYRIIGQSIENDEKKRGSKTGIVGLAELSYYTRGKNQHCHIQQMDRSELKLGYPLEKPIEDICKELFRAIREAEKNILARISEPNQDIVSILQAE